MKYSELRAVLAAKGQRACGRCGSTMKVGTAFAPVVGSPGTEMGALKGYCVMPVGAVPVPCNKCPKCGYSETYGTYAC